MTRLLAAAFLAFPAVVVAQPTSDRDAFAMNLSTLMDASVERIAPRAEAFLSCVPSELADVTVQAAAFAATEPLASTRALLTDFSRQLVVQASRQSPCVELAALWNESDPFVRTTGDPGIGLTESDIAAGERLERLAGGDSRQVRSRVLTLWDGYDPEAQAFQRLFLTRLNAWTPAVAHAWSELDATTRHDATRATYSDTVPDADVLTELIGTSEIIEWMGGATFSTNSPDYARYDKVIGLATTGYFGGRPYLNLTAAYRSAISAMNSTMYSNQAFGLIFDLMDLNAEY